MPIPTDTYWNIKKLNVVFALSAVILVAVTIWAILQDFQQAWREPQRHGKIWQAAFVDEKIERDTTPEKEAQIAELRTQQAELNKQLGPDTSRFKELTARINQLDNDRQKMELKFNNDKAELAVKESNLQDAVTAGDKDRVRRLTQEIAKPRADVTAQTEALAAKKDDIAQARKELADHTAPLDAVTSAKNAAN